MRVLVACEYSGIVRDAFAKKGHDAWSCDLLPTETPGNHIQDDVLKHLEGWDLMVAHPPCTYLTVSANKWLNDMPARKSGKLVGEARRKARQEGIDFFMALWNAPIAKVAIENPIGCISSVFRQSNQIVHPNYFGDTVSKATCLWLRGLKPLEWRETDELFGRQTLVEPEVYTTASGKKYPKWSMIEAAKIRDLDKRSHFRSKTFQGIANAMAEQWG